MQKGPVNLSACFCIQGFLCRPFSPGDGVCVRETISRSIAHSGGLLGPEKKKEAEIRQRRRGHFALHASLVRKKECKIFFCRHFRVKRSDSTILSPALLRLLPVKVFSIRFICCVCVGKRDASDTLHTMTQTAMTPRAT